MDAFNHLLLLLLFLFTKMDLNSIIGKNQIYLKTKGQLVDDITSVLSVRILNLTDNSTFPKIPDYIQWKCD